MKKTASAKLSLIILLLSSHLLSCSGDSMPPGGGAPPPPPPSGTQIIPSLDNLDLNFGTNGAVTTSIGMGSAMATAVAIQEDGKIVAAGRSFTGTDSYFAVVRYNTDGSRDSTFGIDGIVTTSIGNDSDTALALAIQGDGKILAAGSHTIVRYNIDGSLDATFGNNGSATNSEMSTDTLAVLQDGKLLMGGRSSSPPSLYPSSIQLALEPASICVTPGPPLPLSVLARYNTDGSLDSTFGHAGIINGVASDHISALAIQSDGKMLAAGKDGFYITRYNADGSRDYAFGNDGFVSPFGYSGNTKSIGIQIDGKIVAAGVFGTSVPCSGGVYDTRFALTRYNIGGSLDSTFGTGGVIITPLGTGSAFLNGLVIQADGKLVVAGSSSDNNYNNYFILVRYNPDGSTDSTFGTGGIVITSAIPGTDRNMATALSIQPDGKLVAAGRSRSSTKYDFALIRYLP